MTPSVGIIGLGFVGTAVYNLFRYKTDVKCYDIAKELDAYEDVVAQDVIFVCVPTPRDSTGTCDVRQVDDVLTKLDSKLDTFKPVIVKSTVPGDYLSTIDIFSNLDVIYSPEFLTERCANNDFALQSRVILGFNAIPDLILGAKLEAITLFEHACPWMNVEVVTREEASLLKYVLNSFFAVKISYFNEIRQVADAAGVDYNGLLRLVVGDGRIAPSHTDVPGQDGEFGFGGKCLPKDLDEFISRAQRLGIDPKVMIAAREKNKEVR
jgi:UDPglucose 6-dehydrogenase